MPAGLELHLILDNYGALKTDKVKVWLTERQLCHVHFTPTPASWLNLVERFVSMSSERRIKRQAHTRVTDLEDFTRHYLSVYNENPKHFQL